MNPRPLLALPLLVFLACSSDPSSSVDGADGGTDPPADAGKNNPIAAPDGAPPGCRFNGQGPNAAKVASSVGDGAAWQSPENAFAKDGTFTTVTLDGADSAELVLRDYGFTIPETATVIGYELQFVRQAEGDVYDEEIRILSGELRSPTKKFFGPLWPKSAAGEHIYGNEADAWGLRLAGKAITTKDFGVSIKVKRGPSGATATAKIDTARLSVLFCE